MPKARAEKSPPQQGVKQAKEVLLRLRKQRGAMSKLAADLGITQQAVQKWEVVPIARVLEVERALGISRKQLRPDLFRLFQEASWRSVCLDGLQQLRPERAERVAALHHPQR